MNARAVVIDWDERGVEKLFKSKAMYRAVAAEAARKTARMNIKARSISHSPMRNYFAYEMRMADHCVLAIIHPNTKAAHAINAKHNIIGQEASNA